MERVGCRGGKILGMHVQRSAQRISVRGMRDVWIGGTDLYAGEERRFLPVSGTCVIAGVQLIVRCTLFLASKILPTIAVCKPHLV